MDKPQTIRIQHPSAIAAPGGWVMRVGICRMNYLTAVILIVVIAPAVSAQDASQRWGIYAGVAYTDYHEFNTHSQRLNREHGLLPGFGLQASGQWQRWFWLARLSAFKGSVDYNGQTQLGHALATHTSSRLLGGSARLGYWLSDAGKWGLFAHLAARQWNRDIHSTGAVQGLSERYRWLEAGAGLRHVWSRADDNHWGQAVALTAFATVAGSVKAYLSAIQGANLEDARLHTGDSVGARLQYTVSMHIGSNTQLHLRPQLAYWRFGRSETVRGTTEPRSDNWRLGLFVGVTL